MPDSSKYVFLYGANDSAQARIAGFDASSRTGRKVAYEWEGHTPFAPYLQKDPTATEYWHLLWVAADDTVISRPKVIINCMADADSLTKALALGVKTVASAAALWPGVPVFNDPARVLVTTRDQIAALFANLPGITIPKTVRCRPRSVAELIATIALHGLQWPVIVRPCGAHAGEGTVWLQSLAERDRLEAFAYDGRDYYLTHYVDYRDSAGLYTKTRLLWLDGVFYPRHSITTDQWQVHARSRNFMAGRADLKRREAEALDKFAKLLSPAALQSLQTIARTVGLDYLGFDGCIRPDGSFLVFEINAAQNGMAPSDYNEFPYLEPYVEKLQAAFNQRITQLVGHV